MRSHLKGQIRSARLSSERSILNLEPTNNSAKLTRATLANDLLGSVPIVLAPHGA